MYTSEVIYQGQLRCKATHLRSQSVIVTDAPVDNNGKGEAFSPTDLVAAALGTCMLTVMGIEANKLKVNVDDSALSVMKHMGVAPRRIVKLEVKLDIPDNGLSQDQKDKLSWAAINCPVAKSLHPDLAQEIVITYVKTIERPV